MTDAPNTFGGRILDLAPDAILAAEADRGIPDTLTNLLAPIALAVLAGEDIVQITDRPGPDRTDRVAFDGTSSDAFARWEQQALESAGAWYLQPEITVRPGILRVPTAHATAPRWIGAAIHEQRNRLVPADNPEATFLTTVLLPLFDLLFAPVRMRTGTGKPKKAEVQRAAWADVTANLDAIGLDVADVLAPLRYGSGWSGLRAKEMIAVRSAWVDAIIDRVTADTIGRWRALRTRQLAEAFYKKAKRRTPKAATVLTRAVQPYVVGLFDGSWLRFLDYLEEPINDDDRIMTALPEERLLVTAGQRTASVAAATGVAVDEVERILATFLGNDRPAATTAPVPERVEAMRRWWDCFDDAHAAQASGMVPLWGLVDEGRFAHEADVESSINQPVPRGYTQHLPADLGRTIDRLWGGVVLRERPARIVTEFHPHRLFADAFGPAVGFWHGVALTCWFICEGPYSRTDLPGLADYHARDVHALAELGTPVAPTLFADLVATEGRLGEPAPVVDRVERFDNGVVMTTHAGMRRDGFRYLNDVVTRHRRAWADAHLDTYLRALWDTELRAVARGFARRTAERAGRPPTFKQFVTAPVVTAANRWFGGDVGALYAAMGEVAPVEVVRASPLEVSPDAFAETVHRLLGGPPPGATERDHDIDRMVYEAVKYVQLSQARGVPPSQEDIGIEWRPWDAIGGVTDGWVRFESAIRAALSPAGQR